MHVAYVDMRVYVGMYLCMYVGIDIDTHVFVTLTRGSQTLYTILLAISLS